ncbi:hypothetical protein WG66_001390 [Moniliophthora roreri]|nr:hypothetical protein WG66_001390 [Moniliophthora roreri]
MECRFLTLYGSSEHVSVSQCSKQATHTRMHSDLSPHAVEPINRMTCLKGYQGNLIFGREPRAEEIESVLEKKDAAAGEEWVNVWNF